MVFYFKSSVVSPPAVLYMGRDKYENEELIRWGWPEDLWFHVHNYSSAHVYLRLEKGQSLSDIPASVLNDAIQLVKANSINGNKLNNIEVVYTPWANLKKTPGMEPGEVAYFNENDVIKVRVEKRVNEIINRLNKTRTEENPDLRQQREARDAAEREEKKHLLRQQKDQEKELLKQKEQESQLRSYDRLMKPENMTTNHDDGNDSDDFM